MCLIALAVNAHPDYPLVLAANRDEFFARPTKALHAWPNSAIVAGRDEQQGGTWLGVTKTGKLAVVTNFRGPGENTAKPKSRGHLITNYLNGSSSPQSYCENLSSEDSNYAGYNLIVGQEDSFYYHSNRNVNHGSNQKDEEALQLTTGIHGLSNHLLNTPWPKVSDTKNALEAALNATEGCDAPTQTTLVEKLFLAFRSCEKAKPSQLPSTGISPEHELQLSSPFVKLEKLNYGTRCTTIVIKNRLGKYFMVERSWDAQGKLQTEHQFEWSLTL